jgi:outer membrane protein assembly factor BamB
VPEKGQDSVYMLRKIVKWVAIGVVAVLVLAGGLYAFGLRIVLYGGGTPRLEFVESERTRTERIARDRASHRDVPPPAAVPVDTAPAAAPVTMGSAPAQAPAPTDTLPAASPAAPSYWTDFRGPHRDGHYRERPILTLWPGDGLKPLWKQPIGGGYASFVIARGRAFTIEQRDTQEVVAAYDVATGRQLWTAAWTALFREGMGGDGPRATPTWADGRVYALGGMGELRCLDETTGQTFWRTNILEDAGASNLQWGMAAAPLIVDDTVIVVPGGGRGRSVAAYDRNSGKKAWSALDDQAAYSSPMLVTIGGVRQVLVFTASRLVAISPERGSVLWEYPWKTDYDVNAGQPLLIGENRVFISSGYGKGAAVLEITRSGDTFPVREIWRNNRMKNQFTSSVLHEGFIYGLDEAILACLDAATGAVKWKGGRYGYGQIMLASGHLIVLTEEGDLVLVRATPDSHQEVGRFPALNGKTWNHPAMSGGYLLVRNINDMAAFDLRIPGR